MKNKIAIIMSGICSPAREIALDSLVDPSVNNICRTHDYFTKNGEYTYNKSEASESHQYCIRKFISLAQEDKQYISVNNTSASLLEIAPYYDIAKSYGYLVMIYRVGCSYNYAIKNNPSKIPELTLNGMYFRFQDFKMPKFWKAALIEEQITE